MAHLLSGCSFTDPVWQNEIPWSVCYSLTHPSYIVAKAGMGIRGICTETLYYLQSMSDINKVILMLPTLWRLDIEVDQESYLCNAMVDRLYAQQGNYKKDVTATRKWLISGGLNYDKNTEQSKIFDLMYKHQGFLVLLKEHTRALRMLLDYCRSRRIEYHITAIQDPMNQLQGLDYIKDEIESLLDQVEYKDWFKFDGKFVDEFLNHPCHPTTREHQVLCEYILNYTN